MLAFVVGVGFIVVVECLELVSGFAEMLVVVLWVLAFFEGVGVVIECVELASGFEVVVCCGLNPTGQSFLISFMCSIHKETWAVSIHSILYSTRDCSEKLRAVYLLSNERNGRPSCFGMEISQSVSER